MTVGKDTFNGMAVPLKGDFEVVQRQAGYDIMTMTGVANQTGDFLVCRDSSGNELAGINVEGAIFAKDFSTTPPTLGELANDGGFAFANNGTVGGIWFRQNGTLYYTLGTAA
jgi:hypothetical protein